MSAQSIQLLVETSDCLKGKMRLDQFLASRLGNTSRTFVKKLIEEGQVLVDEKPAKAGMILKSGMKVAVTIPQARPVEIEAEDLDIDVLFDDQYLAVINKPCGMVTHPGAGVSSHTLVNALLHQFKDSLSGISGELRPGIVHRLDKDTSGLLVIAKADEAHRQLAEQIREKSAKRIYTAVVEGIITTGSGSVDKPIGRHPTRRKEMAIVPTGKKAVTHYEVIKRGSKYTLIKVRLETGRTHQIRVHMNSLGYPIVGDIVYNKKSTGSLAARHKLGLNGHALHAAQLCFTHPVTGKLLEFEVSPPKELSALINSL